MSRGIDLLITYRVIKLLVTPWERTQAFKLGIIDNKGKVLRKFKTIKSGMEKKHYTVLHRFVFNLRRILQKVGLGSRLGSFAVALALLIKEDRTYTQHKDLIESAVVTYLKEEKLYDMLLNEHTDGPEIDVAPYITAFGVDVYERGDELVAENEYAQAL
jgi:hypothetical protein